MDKYKVTTEIYHEYMKFKSNLLRYLTSLIFINYQKYIDSGDLIFTGSIVYDKLDIIKKEYFGDIDISISDNFRGDEIKHTFVRFLGQIDLSQYKKIFTDSFQPNILENNKHLTFDQIIAIDAFTNVHPENSRDCENIKLFPNIYTKYFGHEWNLDKFYNSYQSILEIKNEEKRIAQVKKFKNLFETFLKLININDFQDKVLLNNIMDVIKK